MESEIAAKIEIWKTTVETQQHFNDLQLRLRSFLITLFLAVLTAAAYALKEHIIIRLWIFAISLSGLVCVFGAVMVAAFYVMDWGYHQLLMGAVGYGEDIEDSLKDLFPGDGLTHAISKSSKATKLLWLKTHSHLRLNLFYAVLFGVMVLAAVGSHLVSTASVGARPTKPDQRTSRSSRPTASATVALTAIS
jgi:phosphoglycerol transferase MdoB-like AlkP superfamily enzyme